MLFMERRAGQTVPGGKGFVWILLIVSVLVLLSRGITLNHNASLHPDEYVFFRAADSLKEKMCDFSQPYTEVKEYPEGAIVFQAPFHLAADILWRLTGIKIDMRTCGRIASVFYFALGAALGLWILFHHRGKKPGALIIFGCTAVFSVLHMEQSRYGTGESVTMFLIMAMICLCARGLRRKKLYLVCIYGAGFLAGALGAVKYPQIFFAVIPFAAALRLTRRYGGNAVCSAVLALTFSTIIGFLFFSPKVLRDPAYIFRTSSRELLAYMRVGNLSEIGGATNHAASLLLYMLLYSGLPLAPIFLFSGVKYKGNRRTENDVDFLFVNVLPLAMTLFFLYNLFVRTLFMRTYYPFFCVADLYVSAAAADWLEDRRWKRATVLVLLTLLIGRGMYYVAALSEHDDAQRFKTDVDNAVDEGWKKTVFLEPGVFLSIDKNGLVSPERRSLGDEELETDAALELQPGTLVITGTQDFSRCNHYFFPINHELAREMIRRWDVFKRVNEPYYVGQAYPTAYYYLFGYWIKGTTGTDYEFPSNRVYYRG